MLLCPNFYFLWPVEMVRGRSGRSPLPTRSGNQAAGPSPTPRERLPLNRWKLYPDCLLLLPQPHVAQGREAMGTGRPELGKFPSLLFSGRARCIASN